MAEEVTDEALGTEEPADEEIVQHPDYDDQDFTDDTDAGEDLFDVEEIEDAPEGVNLGDEEGEDA